MTREEAIRCLSVHSSTNGSGLCTDKQHYEAKQMAIKALEQEPCSDAISRQAAVNIASGFCHFANIADELAKLPPVNPQPKTDVLDKIRADVKHMIPWDKTALSMKLGVLKIIDKYKAEVEPQESEVSDADSN